jgi:hypothetical protein
VQRGRDVILCKIIYCKITARRTPRFPVANSQNNHKSHYITSMITPLTGLLLIFIEKTDKTKTIQLQPDQMRASLADNQPGSLTRSPSPAFELSEEDLLTPDKL